MAQGAKRFRKNKPASGKDGDAGGNGFSVRREKILPLAQE